MDSPSVQSPTDNLQRQAHDNAVKAGKLLADAQIKLERAEAIVEEANIRLSNVRKFEEVLKERQKKLDRAFVLLNKQKRQFEMRQLRDADRKLLIDDNIAKF